MCSNLRERFEDSRSVERFKGFRPLQQALCNGNITMIADRHFRQPPWSSNIAARENQTAFRPSVAEHHAENPGR